MNGTRDEARERAQVEIVDHATGVAGTYCIGRREGKFMSFWNPDGWAGSGYVFTDIRIAKAVLKGLTERASGERAGLELALEGIKKVTGPTGGWLVSPKKLEDAAIRALAAEEK